jgi:hypothetical protein
VTPPVADIAIVKKILGVAGSLLCVAALVTGCSSSDGLFSSSEAGRGSFEAATGARSATASASTPSASRTTPGAAGSAAAGVPATADQLSAVVLRAGDLPPEWTSTSSSNGGGSDQSSDGDAALACLGGVDTSADSVDEFDSPDFTLDDADISSDATSYASQASVDADTATLSSPKASGCFEQLLKTEVAATLPAGATISAATFVITPGPNGGPANVVAVGRGEFTIDSSGVAVNVYLAMGFITGPLLEAEVDFENPTQPIPAAMFASLLSTVAARAATV